MQNLLSVAWEKAVKLLLGAVCILLEELEDMGKPTLDLFVVQYTKDQYNTVHLSSCQSSQKFSGPRTMGHILC